MEHDPALLTRVRKLLDKAEGTRNEHEADAFARKAAELVARHRIDVAQLAASADPDDLGVERIHLGRGAYVRARLALLMAVAAAHDVQVVFQATPTGTEALAAGFRSDLDVVTMMYQSLHQQAAARMAGIRRGTGAATQRYRRSFLFGFADRLGEILAEARRATEAAAPDTAGTALAVRERADRVDDHARQVFGRVRTARRPSAALASGWQAGTRAADGVDVGRARLSGRRAIGRGRRG